MQRSRSRTYIGTKAGNRKGVREQPDVKFNRKRPQDSHYKDVHRYKGNHNLKNKGQCHTKQRLSIQRNYTKEKNGSSGMDKITKVKSILDGLYTRLESAEERKKQT